MVSPPTSRAPRSHVLHAVLSALPYFLLSTLAHADLNIVIKNTCSGNTTNWDIVASNYYGPIIDRTGVVTAAVVGSAAASSLGSTDANANFSY